MKLAASVKPPPPTAACGKRVSGGPSEAWRAGQKASRFLSKPSDRLTAERRRRTSLAATKQTSDRGYRKGPAAALRPTYALHTEHIAQ